MRAEDSAAQERFQHWLAHMDDYLDELMRSVPPDLAARLDYSGESLDAIEARILDRFPSIEHAKAQDAAAEVNLYAIYVGEVFRKALGGRWTLPTDDPKYAYYRLPVLDYEHRSTICPITLVTASTSRRTGEFIGRVFRNAVARP